MSHPSALYRYAWLAVFALVVAMFLRLPPMVAKEDAVVTTYRTLVEVDALARQKFVEPIESGSLVAGAIRGMMLELDPYSGYLSAAQLQALEEKTSGSYGDTGIAVGMRNGQPIVIAPLEGSPASAAGVLAGDEILAVNGTDTEGLSVLDIEERLHGVAGTPVRLRLAREGESEPAELSVVRSAKRSRSVRGFRRHADGTWNYIIEKQGNIGYVRLSSFANTTPAQLENALETLNRQHADAVILDLRFNPGGLLEAGVAVVDQFITKGLIVSMVSRRQAVREYMATRSATAPDIPLVILVNGASASASEMVAGALQHYHRAIVVGQRSFGKGSVQQVIRLHGSDAGIKLTMAYYRLPSGRIIHRHARNVDSQSWGIIPDRVVELSSAETKRIQDSRRAIDSLHTDRLPNNDQPNTSRANEQSLLMDRQLQAAITEAERLSHMRQGRETKAAGPPDAKRDTRD